MQGFVFVRCRKDYASVLNTFDNDDRYKKLESIVIKAKAKSLKDELNKKLSSKR